jgi:acetyltransferase
VDLAALEQIMVRFSQLVVEQRWIKEIDINPLLVSHERLIALDARVVLHEPEVREEQLPRLAIRPYPAQYVDPWTLKVGTPVLIRPIRPEDEPLIVRFHESLSEESVYLRYFHLIQLSQRVAHERLIRICFLDYDRDMALVADHQDSETGEHEILGVGRLSRQPGTREAEFAVLVSDKAQGQGLGTELVRRLLHVGREENIHRVTAEVLPQNRAMQRICERLGFRLHHDRKAEVVKVEIDLLEN